MQRFLVGKGNIKDLALEIYKSLDSSREPVFVCVGSDKYVCDSISPIVAVASATSIGPVVLNTIPLTPASEAFAAKSLL